MRMKPAGFSLARSTAERNGRPSQLGHRRRHLLPSRRRHPCRSVMRRCHCFPLTIAPPSDVTAIADGTRRCRTYRTEGCVATRQRRALAHARETKRSADGAATRTKRACQDSPLPRSHAPGLSRGARWVTRWGGRACARSRVIRAPRASPARRRSCRRSLARVVVASRGERRTHLEHEEPEDEEQRHGQRERLGAQEPREPFVVLREPQQQS